MLSQFGFCEFYAIVYLVPLRTVLMDIYYIKNDSPKVAGINGGEREPKNISTVTIRPVRKHPAWYILPGQINLVILPKF